MESHKTQNLPIILLVVLLVSFCFPVINVQAANTRPTVNIASEDFKFVVCDGPDLKRLPAGEKVLITLNGKQIEVTNDNIPSNYIPCDFNGLILTVQHLIDIAIVFGVLVALGSFCYIGYLYITGTQANRAKAKSIFPKIFFGFIIMLASWFIVYQLLTWLGASQGSKALLGSSNSQTL